MIDKLPDDFSNSDYRTNHITTPTAITSPPPFYTIRPNKFNRMARFKLLPKRKQNLHPKIYHKTATLHFSRVQNPTLPNKSNVKTAPNDFCFDNTPTNNDNHSPVKVYSKTNYPYPQTSF